MSKKTKASNEPVQNAVKIIDKFGGIRPMSAKMGVAVTTIQGWKKRDAIPAARLDDVIKAAQENNINLSGLVDIPEHDESSKKGESQVIQGGMPHKDNMVEEEVADAVDDVVQEGGSSESTVEDHGTTMDDGTVESVTVIQGNDVEKGAGSSKKQDEFSKKTALARPMSNKSYTEIEVKPSKPMVSRGTAAIAAAILLLLTMVVVATFMPDFKSDDRNQVQAERIVELEEKLAKLSEEQGRFKGLTPENWQDDLDSLKAQLQETRAGVARVAGQVKTASQEVINDPRISERAEQLQNYIATVTTDNRAFSLLERFKEMEQDEEGEGFLNRSVLALSEVFSNAKGQSDAQINAALESARAQNEALQQTLGNVPQDELKAAAMLLAMTQMRSALARPEESFDSDLELLMGMVGEDNVGLRSSLEKIAPHAKSGVLSGSGLRKEFQSVAGEVVEASLKGEDVSFSEKLSARFNDILQVEKDGEIITGTQTQAKLHTAESMINKDQWGQALDYLNKSMSAKELAPLKPWMEKVEAAVSASTMRKALEDSIELNFGDGMLGGQKLLGDR